MTGNPDLQLNIELNREKTEIYKKIKTMKLKIIK